MDMSNITKPLNDHLVEYDVSPTLFSYNPNDGKCSTCKHENSDYTCGHKRFGKVGFESLNCYEHLTHRPLNNKGVFNSQNLEHYSDKK